MKSIEHLAVGDHIHVTFKTRRGKIVTHATIRQIERGQLMIHRDDTRTQWTILPHELIEWTKP